MLALRHRVCGKNRAEAFSFSLSASTGERVSSEKRPEKDHSSQDRHSPVEKVTRLSGAEYYVEVWLAVNQHDF